MVTTRDKILAELENIDQLIAEIPEQNELTNLSTLELAGVGALLNNFYNGVENILKQILKHIGEPLPQSGSWHKDMLELAVTKQIISLQIKKQFMIYLAFRHYFNHAYALDLQPDKLIPLVQKITETYLSFKIAIEKWS